MRTAIFVGLIFIGDAINNSTYDGDNKVITFMASLLIVFAVMDVIDFLRKNMRGEKNYNGK